MNMRNVLYLLMSISVTSLRMVDLAHKLDSARDAHLEDTNGAWRSKLHKANEKNIFFHERGLHINYAAAFGGGGCYSSISQLGYLRGLDDAAALNAGAAYIQKSVAATVSGGTWAASMVIADQSIHSASNSSALGAQCMMDIIHRNIPRDEWRAAYRKCAGCIATPWDVCSPWEWREKVNYLFGVNKYCLSDVSKVNTFQFMTSDDLKYLMRKVRKGHTPADKIWELYVHKLFLEDIGVKMDDTVTGMLDRAYSPKDDLQKDPIMFKSWSVLATGYTWESSHPSSLTVRPIQVLDVNPDTVTLVEAATDSSQFPNLDIGQNVILSMLWGDQPGWLKIIKQQTADGLYPWPWTPIDQNKHSDFLKSLFDRERNSAFFEKHENITDPMNVTTESLHELFSGVRQDPTRFQEHFRMSPQRARETLSNLLHQEKHSSAGLTMTADGAGVDQSGIGAALQVLEASQSKATSLVAMVTFASVMEDPIYGYCADFYKGQKEYYKLLGSKNYLDFANVTVNELLINNPNHFFKLSDESLMDCTSQEEMLDGNSTCMNFKQQSKELGIILVGTSWVVPNTFWDIRGGWPIDVFFVTLTLNKSQKRWFRAITGKSLSLNLRKYFPIYSSPAMNFIKFAMGLPTKLGFHLTEWASYQSHLLNCMLMAHESKGKVACTYCTVYPDDKDCKMVMKIGTGAIL
jgi:hypothetical protein